MRDGRFPLANNPTLKSFFFVVLFDRKVKQNLQFKSILMPFAQGSQARSGRPWAALEKAPLLSNGAECPGIGNGEGKAVFILAANGPESQAAKLESDSTARCLGLVHPTAAPGSTLV